MLRILGFWPCVVYSCCRRKERVGRYYSHTIYMTLLHWLAWTLKINYYQHGGIALFDSTRFSRYSCNLLIIHSHHKQKRHQESRRKTGDAETCAYETQEAYIAQLPGLVLTADNSLTFFIGRNTFQTASKQESRVNATVSAVSYRALTLQHSAWIGEGQGWSGEVALILGEPPTQLQKSAPSMHFMPLEYLLDDTLWTTCRTHV